ncbi:uncharacterized protein Gasu_05420 [Galdieria sulphuraria]|uniref:Uncharacterized protein n=1 Tax=Galdieria sulphuraria TaxID=130081 RepID=M2Y8F4_GALSU|nr:uncharacterized protein Gasu_05420 [Galdieria sulphuraria]EME32124.1 hypothetical protein Gasu_05420 [Galdieria sulphuraria]|eukprot:XP_005708644.1 hypothetical protein Gasu_05420 [Galdieria sulphuraria]
MGSVTSHLSRCVYIYVSCSSLGKKWERFLWKHDDFLRRVRVSILGFLFQEPSWYVFIELFLHGEVTS